MKKYKKIIVWGAKPDTGHTHAFIHGAIVRAAKSMGIETYWLDNRNNVPSSFFDDSIIVTEQWLAFQNGYSNNLPLRKSSCYLVHYLGNKGAVEGNPGAQMYLGKVGKLIDFRFTAEHGWGVNGEIDKNYAYRFEPSKYEAFNEVSFYEKSDDYDRFYTIWATDLLPDEIDFSARFTPLENRAFFCGTIREDNHMEFKNFIEKCDRNKIPFLFNSPTQNQLSTEEVRKYAVSSLLPLDCRPKNHLANGYIACRTIKNVSYGALGMTNSKSIYDFFDGRIAYAPDSGDLFDVAIEMQNDPKTKDVILDQMTWIKEKHTYINRVKDIIKAAEI
jgi:hypothetical protein